MSFDSLVTIQGFKRRLVNCCQEYRVIFENLLQPNIIQVIGSMVKLKLC